MFLKISQNSQENTCARVSFFIKLHALRHATLSKKRLEACNFIKNETLAQVFSCEFCEFFLKKPFIKEQLRWLLLCFQLSIVFAKCSTSDVFQCFEYAFKMSIGNNQVEVLYWRVFGKIGALNCLAKIIWKTFVNLYISSYIIIISHNCKSLSHLLWFLT